jgi:hypothetical protein
MEAGFENFDQLDKFGILDAIAVSRIRALRRRAASGRSQDQPFRHPARHLNFKMGAKNREKGMRGRQMARR